jgi:menaquinol-cytochrome c reductase cytochrome b subunit
MSTLIPPPKELVKMPVDWVEERSGLVSVGKYFLFRNVPKDISWLQTLGASLLTVFIIQVTTAIMVILLFLHMGRVFLFGAYKYPREMTWVTGAVIFILVMAMSLTGYLLVFDQRAYWATVVAININGTAPILGPFLSEVLKVGPEFGTNTLSRFYSLHMLVIPSLIGGLIALHLWLVIRLGVSSPPWSKHRVKEGDL